MIQWRADRAVFLGIRETRHSVEPIGRTSPKSEKRDACGLAAKLRVGNLDNRLFRAPRQFTQIREFSRTHVTLVRDVVRAQARIKTVYRSRGALVTGSMSAVLAGERS